MEWQLPLLIYCARICDVSVGTVRIILVTRGHKVFSALFGIVEVTIWLFAVSTVITHLQDNIWMIVAYAAGYATGTLVGMTIEERLALGSQMVRVVIPKSERSLAPLLRQRGLTVTEVPAFSASGEAELCFFALPRREVPTISGWILAEFPGAYLSVEDLRRNPQGSGLYPIPGSRLNRWRRLIKFK